MKLLSPGSEDCRSVWIIPHQMATITTSSAKVARSVTDGRASSRGRGCQGTGGAVTGSHPTALPWTGVPDSAGVVAMIRSRLPRVDGGTAERANGKMCQEPSSLPWTGLRLQTWYAPSAKKIVPPGGRGYHTTSRAIINGASCQATLLEGARGQPQARDP
ncbi:MAG: hypothetical protein NZ899_13770 [Thermoguttaceae bacterium]|nr:hypothetical protein [Thermoguttaceae bacterium]MDW8080010.1 hypothetical protein [Thermoguttaceae bacterium]